LSLTSGTSGVIRLGVLSLWARLSERTRYEHAAKSPRARSLPEKLEQARTDVAKSKRIAADPELSLRAALAAWNLARSSQAAATLFEKALQYERQVNDSESQARLMKSLGIKPLL
jgi:hypothetical protein